MNALSLYDLNNIIKTVLNSTMVDEYWVQGELSEASVRGHFYGELIQKDEDGGGIIARARLNCWANRYPLVARHFEQATGETLRAGMKVLLLVKVTFHEAYGYSLLIQDIDPTYTLGKMAQQRKLILQQLEKDGILHDNQTLPFPTLCQRIAVISSESAAGYGDFCDQLKNNTYGLGFHLQLFPAVMQGQHVEESIIASLMTIADEAELWDCVVIIRGGGATSDLSDFDSYPLAACIAQFPLPVLTGIGHERDETVLDYVAHIHLKTPTAVAAFLVDHQHQQMLHLEDLQQRITNAAHDRIAQGKQRLERYAMTFPLAFRALQEREQQRLLRMSERFQQQVALRLERERNRLTLMEQHLRSLDPTLLLQRGYSITTCNGRLVRSKENVKPGDKIETRLEHETITSIITNG